MKISIVTTSFNQARFLDEALESVRQQNYSEIEHIVVDGASHDGTVELLQKKSGVAWRHLRWISESDRGQSDAMNKGLQMATGDVIGWLNSDDRYRSGCLETIARAMQQNPDVDILYGDYTFMNENGEIQRVRREIEFNKLVLFYHHVLHIPTTSSFFRRRIFSEGNFLDESLHYAMDHDFYMRLAMRGYRFQHVSALLADFRLHPASKSVEMAKKQLAEGRMLMRRRSSANLGTRSGFIDSLCFTGLQLAAKTARYTEKLCRGYYLPDFILRRERLKSLGEGD